MQFGRFGEGFNRFDPFIKRSASWPECRKNITGNGSLCFEAVQNQHTQKNSNTNYPEFVSYDDVITSLIKFAKFQF